MKKYIKPETLCVEINSAAMMTEWNSKLGEGSDDKVEVTSKLYYDDSWDDEE